MPGLLRLATCPGEGHANPTGSKHIVNRYATVTIDDTASAEMLRWVAEPYAFTAFPQFYRSEGNKRTLVLHHH
jgi:hypothetical protein